MKRMNVDVPEVYRPFLPELFNQEIPEESFATCDNCAMVCHNPVPNQAISFLPDVKCCSYYPGLPNYLIGGILESTDPALAEGQARVRERIEHKVGVTPVGIQPSAKYSLFFTTTTNGFGQSHDLLCPYYERGQGNCTIWPYREAVCTTFFCKPTAGSAGKMFWGAIKQYFLTAQQELCNYVLLELGLENVYEIVANFKFSPGQTTQISVADMQEQPPASASYERFWQQWNGREEAFYRTAYRLVKQLSPEAFDKIMGRKHQTLCQYVAAKWRDMVVLPPTLVKNPALNLQPNGNGHYLIQYDSIDVAFELPTAVLDAFDGQQPQQGHDLEIDEALLISLHKNQVLVSLPDKAVTAD